MVPGSRIDPGPPLVEMVFKAAALAALTLIVNVIVLPFVAMLLLRVFAADASFEVAIGVVGLALLLALGVTLIAVVWSVARDVVDRRRAKVRRASGRGRRG